LDQRGEFALYEQDITLTFFKLSCITAENLPCKADVAQSFMRESIAYFRRTDFVERWVWDGANLDFDAYVLSHEFEQSADM